MDSTSGRLRRVNGHGLRLYKQCLSLRRLRFLVGGVVLSLLLTGCGPLPTGSSDGVDGGNGMMNDAEDVMATIVNITTDFPVSVQLDTSLTVLYTVTGSSDAIAGFFVPVSAGSPGTGDIEDHVITDPNLPPGTSRAFDFNPQVAGVGFFRVGVVVTVGEEDIVAESEGVIHVTGLPDPVFVQPVESITEAVAGDGVLISFDAGDPEGDVQWRVFYLDADDDRDSSPHLLGTEIVVGSGNIGQLTFDTTGLAPGDYELGVSATDSGLSVAETAANDDFDRIVTIPTPTQSGPIVRITE